MTGSTHFITGAAIGKLTGNPVLAAVFGFAFHFIMDIVPHWDYGYHFKKRISNFLIAASDPFIGFLIFLVIGLWKGFTPETWIVTFIGGAFCALPDVISVFSKTFKINQFYWLIRFHDRLHWFIKQERNIFEFEEIPVTKKGFILGVLYQVPFILVSLWVLVY